MKHKLVKATLEKVCSGLEKKLRLLNRDLKSKSEELKRLKCNYNKANDAFGIWLTERQKDKEAFNDAKERHEDLLVEMAEITRDMQNLLEPSTQTTLDTAIAQDDVRIKMQTACKDQQWGMIPMSIILNPETVETVFPKRIGQKYYIECVVENRDRKQVCVRVPLIKSDGVKPGSVIIMWERYDPLYCGEM